MRTHIIPSPRSPFDPVMALRDLAESNGLFATDILRKATEKPQWRWVWHEMLESVGLDVEDVTMEMAERADTIVRARIRIVQDKLRPEPVVEVDLEPIEQQTGKRTQLFGFPITSIVRWMATDDWTFEYARIAFKLIGIPISDSTIRAQLHAGARGQRGEPAQLTEDQKDYLYSVIED